MATNLKSVNESVLSQNILKTLCYFDIFSYPLSEEELRSFLQTPALEPIILRAELVDLVAEQQIYRFGDWYQIRDDASWSDKRILLNQRADQFMPMARRMARFIGAFPFIRSVCVSGSLSKHCMAADGDIDFFMITAPGRLWLARTLLVVFKKVFLLNSHKYFCINYFIDEQHLEIEEKNLFTATECVTLLPMYCETPYQNFQSANHWAWQILPLYPLRASPELKQSSIFKKVAEWCLGGALGTWLDRRCMQWTVNYWRKKFKHLDPQAFDIALKSRSYVSKHHPLQYQDRVIKAYEERVRSS